MGEEALIQPDAVCGFLNVLKPPGMSSAAVVGRVRRMLKGEKVGHAGTLDPEAAGVLPLMVGKAARLFDYLQEKQKAYLTEVAFGCATDTQDAQGTAVAQGDAFPAEQAVRAALLDMVGEGLQTPPMYSALKHEGQRLYDLARKGEVLSLPARPVTVFHAELRRMMPRQGALIAVECSKGFYVRTLCHDLGVALGCPAHMRFLLRTRSGAFTLETANTLEQLSEAVARGGLPALITPMDAPLSHLASVSIPAKLAKPFANGVPLRWDTFAHSEPLEEGQTARLYLQGALVAIGQRQGDRLTIRTWLGM